MQSCTPFIRAVVIQALVSLLQCTNADAGQNCINGVCCFDPLLEHCAKYGGDCRSPKYCCSGTTMSTCNSQLCCESFQCGSTCNSPPYNDSYVYGSPCKSAPATCGSRCGTVPDGCGGDGKMSCGGCGTDQTCVSNQCVCNALPACTADYCGTVSNACDSKTCGCGTDKSCVGTSCVCDELTCPSDFCGVVSNACDSKNCGCGPDKSCVGTTCVCDELTCPPDFCGVVSNACDSKICSCRADTTCSGTSCICNTVTCFSSSCGNMSNSCGYFADCGGCNAGEECVSNRCICPPLECAPDQQCGFVANACTNSSLSCGTCNATLPNCVNGTCVLLPLGPNMTVGVSTVECNASLFNKTAFVEELVDVSLPLIVDPATVVILSVRCVGTVLEVTFAIHGSTTGQTMPPPTGPGGSNSVTVNGTTWQIINWPGYSTLGTSTTRAPSAVVGNDISESVVSASSFDVRWLILGMTFCAVALCVSCVAIGCRQRGHSTSADNDVAMLTMHATLQVTALEQIGSGNFGAVYAGLLDHSNKRIAIKEVRSGNAEEMMREAAMLTKCQHEFVVRMLGVVQSEMIAIAPGCTALAPGGVCMLTELCEYGSLLDALQKAKSNARGTAVLTLESVSAAWLLQVFWQVAVAMRFLTSEVKVLHRDLAARNVLLARVSNGYTSGLKNARGMMICARVSDFGLSESMYADYYKQGSAHEALPLRWTAPEALLKHKFSEKSDVYSFGALIVETLNMGRPPQSTLSNAELVPTMSAATRTSIPYPAAFDLDKPVPFVAPGTQEILDEGLWDLAMCCVSMNAEERPTFLDCAVKLERYLSQASVSVVLPLPRTINYADTEQVQTEADDYQ